MIIIRFNNEVIKIAKNQSLAELLFEKDYKDDYCAVALNRQFVPRAQHAKIFLEANDVVEIITPMQGG